MISRLDQGPRGASSPRLSRITVRGTRRRLSSLSAGLAAVTLGAVVVIVVRGDPPGLALAALEVAAAARLAPPGTGTAVLAGLVLTGLGLISLALVQEGRVLGRRTIRSAWLPLDVAGRTM